MTNTCETIYSSTITYWVLGKAIELFGDETCYGHQTFAEVDSEYLSIGDRLINLHTAIDIYQNIYNIIINDVDFELIIMENALKLLEQEDLKKSKNS